MRMRHKPYAQPELDRCPFFVGAPAACRGVWRQQFARPQAPMVVELGCGKGAFAAAVASADPRLNYLAVDALSDVLVLAKRKAEQAYAQVGRPVDNLLFTALNIWWIGSFFAPEDTAERIYINFPPPWPKNGHKKRRLTWPAQLMQYRPFLREGGEIWFKTDDGPLFEESIGYFESCGFSLRFCSRDLHAAEPGWNLRTEYEERFAARGLPIRALIAVKGPLAGQAAPPPPAAHPEKAKEQKR